MDSIFYPESGTTEAEKAFLDECWTWATTLVATACNSGYVNAIQMSSRQAKPVTSWTEVKKTVKELSISEDGEKIKLNLMKLPSAAAFGKQTRVMGRRASSGIEVWDDLDSGDEMWQDLPW